MAENEKTSNEVLYEKAEEVIEALYSDLSVNQEKALENMQGLRDLIEERIAALETDLSNESDNEPESDDDGQ